MRDLEIRGAGNILGAAQSGHIAAVGFDLYCQLLKRTVAQLKGETAPPIIDVEVKLDFIDLSPGAAEGPNAAVIPMSYVEDENLRIGLYRQIAGASSGKELESVMTGMRDRFGKIPPAADRLAAIARLRIAAAGKRIRRIEVTGDKVMMTQRKDFITMDGKFPRLKSRSAGDKLAELLKIVKAA
jgi:transcription-repair coupling factor (superfamily II helicase)